MHSKDIYTEEEFEEKFTEALAAAAARLPKFIRVSLRRAVVFQIRSNKITRFWYPSIIAVKGSPGIEGIVLEKWRSIPCRRAEMLSSRGVS